MCLKKILKFTKNQDPVESAFFLVRGSGSRGIKIKGKAEFNQQIIFFKYETKKVALGTDLKIIFFFLTFKRWFEINLMILLSWIRP